MSTTAEPTSAEPRRRSWHAPGTAAVSLLAALTGWLTLTAWGPLYQSPSAYLSPLVGVGLLVAGVGMLTRSARWRPALTLAAQVVVVLVWLLHTFEPSSMTGGWLPTPAALADLADDFGSGLAAAREFQAPVPSVATSFAVVMGLGGAAVLLAVDLLACGLRRPPLAGLPLLMAYVIPLSVPDGSVHWLVFVASSLAFLLLVATAEAERLSAWGRLWSPGREQDAVTSTGPSVTARSVRSSARRIGLATTGLAVVLPVLVPSLHWTPLGRDGGEGEGPGSGLKLTNPIVDLKRDLVRGVDVDLVTVRTDGFVPSYLRVTVLNDFDGDTWRPKKRQIPPEQRAKGRLPAIEGLSRQVSRTEVSEEITTSPGYLGSWLPLSYPATFADVPGDWRYDTSTMDLTSGQEEQPSGGITYATRALDVEPTVRQLVDATPAPVSVYAPNVDLPQGFPASVEAIARRVTRGQDTDYEQARALQAWFRDSGNFRYSLDRDPGNGTDDLVQFLSPSGRVGYCEQFAAAMAVLARSLGIPARVSIGFLRPVETQPDVFTFSAHDLHAWPELFFDGVGWVRFEPTPAIQSGAPPSWTVGPIPQSPEQQPRANATQAPRDKKVDNAARGSREELLPRDTGTSSWWLVLPALALAAALLLAPHAVRRRRRRQRRDAEHDPVVVAAAVWAELGDTCVDLGIDWQPGRSVRVSARALLAALGGRRHRFIRASDVSDEVVGPAPEGQDDTRAALERLARFVEQARYARVPSFPVAGREQVDADLDVVVAALRASVSEATVRRADWWPRSVLGPVASFLRAPGSAPLAAWPGRVGRPGAGTAEAGGAEVDRVSTGA